jgi:hypothetical protein
MTEQQYAELLAHVLERLPAELGDDTDFDKYDDGASRHAVLDRKVTLDHAQDKEQELRDQVSQGNFELLKRRYPAIAHIFDLVKPKQPAERIRRDPLRWVRQHRRERYVAKINAIRTILKQTEHVAFSNKLLVRIAVDVLKGEKSDDEKLKAIQSDIEEIIKRGH